MKQETKNKIMLGNAMLCMVIVLGALLTAPMVDAKYAFLATITIAVVTVAAMAYFVMILAIVQHIPRQR